MAALLREALGHVSAVVCAGDLGGVVAQDLSLRYEGLVTRLVLFNTIPPCCPTAAEGCPEVRMAADYFIRQSRDAGGLAAELDTEEKRRRYIAQFYGSLLGSAGVVHARGRGLADRALHRS